MKKWLLVFALVCLVTPAFAARYFDFGGSHTTDSIQLSYNTAPPTKISCTAWFNEVPSQHGGGNLGRIIDQNGSSSTAAFIIDDNYNNSVNTMGFSYPGSVAPAAFTWPMPTQNIWHHLALSFDGTTAADVPIVYIDNVSQSVTTTVAYVIGTPVSANWYIGNRASGTRVWYGRLADVACWGGKLLTVSEVSALYNGLSPLAISYTDLLFYLPITGYQANEADLGPNHSTQTMTGTPAGYVSPKFQVFP